MLLATIAAVAVTVVTAAMICVLSVMNGFGALVERMFSEFDPVLMVGLRGETIDGFGSNIFMTKYDNTPNSKVKMGNLWDFDAIMSTPGEWSESHRYSLFVRMFTNSSDTSLTTAYERLWDAQKDSLFIKLYAYLDHLAASEEGKVLNQALKADTQRWGIRTTLEETIETAKAWFEERRIWLQKAIESKKWI